jgi:CO/xanthine dehydrogenase Mo-binding subunit
MAIDTRPELADLAPVAPAGRDAHRDFAEKVAGRLRYADDWTLPGMLHGVVVRSSVACGVIRNVDVAAARAVEGVRAVMTAADVPHNVVGEDESGLGLEPIVSPVLAADRVRYSGEPVVLIAAETAWAAEHAAALVELDIEEQPGVFTVEDALRPDAPPVHADGNRFVQWRFCNGDPDGAMQRADVVVEETYRTQHVDHAYLEPEAGVGWFDGDGVLTLRVSTQVIEHARAIADVVALPHARVRVIGAYMGGGFGGKEDMTVEPYLALLVWKTRRPVRMVWTRQESLQARQKRHPFTMRYRTGATRDGRIVAQDISIVGNAGAYPLLSTRVLFAGAAHSVGPYRCDDVRAESLAVFTNTVPNSAFRGFGAMQVVLGHELQMDRIADVTGLDRAEVRRRNFAQRGDLRPSGERFDTEIGVAECLDAVLEEMGPRRPPRPGVRTGRGIACNGHPYGRNVFMNDHATAWIGFERDGTLVIRAGVTDLGAGQAASLVDIAREILGTTLPTTTVHIGDSALTPLVGGTFATRQLYMSGNAVEQVARELRAKLEPVAADLLGADASGLTWADDAVRVDGDGVRTLSLGELARAAEARGLMPYAHSTFHAETGHFDASSGIGVGRTAPDYTYGAHGADVEVDTETGEVRVVGYVACHDVGRAIDVQRVEGQIEGAVAQGIGYALSEEVVLHDGVCDSTLFADYLIPTSLDIPDIRTIVLERHLGKGPLGARGIGEPPIGPPAPAIASAIADAVGIHLTQLPMTPERVLAALDEAATGGAEAT